MSKYFAVCLLAIAAGSCSVIDDQLEARSNSINQATDFARNDSILLNIVRASRSQPLNFVPFSKVSGTQSSDLRIGVPTLTIGPGQTPAQHQAVFGNNVFDNSVLGSFDLAPLETRDFYRSMLSPVDLQTINILIKQGFPRELVFDSMIEAIRVESPAGAVELKNDPLLEPDDSYCPSAAKYYGRHAVATGAGQNPYSPASPDSGTKYAACEYHRFEFYLQQLMKWGLSIETSEVPNPGYSDAAAKKATAAGKDPPPKVNTISHVCFDRALALRDEPVQVLKVEDRCGSAVDRYATENKDLEILFTEGQSFSAKLKFVLRPRSPLGAFRYFGHIVRVQRPDLVRLYWDEAIFQAGETHVISVVHSGITKCFARISYFGVDYCVPYDGADGTKLVFAILAQLVGLSTASGSLPTTLDVRLPRSGG